MTKNEEYKKKQEWLEAVMADPTIKPVVKVYAFGVKTHMFGVKDESWPGKDAIHAATNLGTGHYSEYTKTLAEAGYLEVTPRRGTSNLYRLTLPTPTGGNHLPPTGVTLPPLGVPPTPTGGTNTTRKTTMNPAKKDSKSASAPVTPSLSENIPTSLTTQTPSFEDIVAPLQEEFRAVVLEATSPLDPATPSLKKSTVQEIKEQAEALSQIEGWTPADTEKIVTLALDTSWSPEVTTAGQRLSKASMQMKYGMEGAW